MKAIFSLILAVAAIQLVSSSVVRDAESETEQTAVPAPPSLPAPPVAPKILQVPEHETTVVAHAVEHTDEHNDETDDKVVEYDPNDSHHESYEVTPQEKLYAEFADSP